LENVQQFEVRQNSASCRRWNSVTRGPQTYITGEKCVTLLLT